MNRIVAATAFSVFFVSGAASANHIDFLDQGAFSFSATGGETATQTVTGIDPGSTLGGQRDMTLSVDGPASNTASASLGPMFADGADDDAMTYTTSAAGTFSLLNGGGGDLNANFLDIPMSENDWDRVRLNFGEGSSAASVTTTLMSSGLGTLTSTMAFDGGDNNLDFLYSDLGASDEFLRDVDSASFEIAASGAGTYTIESFNRNGSVAPGAADVPEPSSIGLFAAMLGLLGFAAYRRRA